MIFLQGNKPRNVWKNGVIATFEKGIIETESTDVINHLMKLGYETENGVEIVIHDAEFVEEVEEEVKEEIVDFESMSIRQLQEYCKKKKYRGYANLSKAKLLEYLAKKV